jgi:hypothetical protein
MLYRVCICKEGTVLGATGKEFNKMEPSQASVVSTSEIGMLCSPLLNQVNSRI